MTKYLLCFLSKYHKFCACGFQHFPVNCNHTRFTRFKDFTCTWLDWNMVFDFSKSKDSEECASGKIMFELKMKFDENTNRVYLIPVRSADALIDEDFNNETNIYELLRNSSQVAIRFATIAKQVSGVNTRLCHENRVCISKCVTKKTKNILKSVSDNEPFIGNSDMPYTNLAKQFLPHCLPQCTSKHCIATDLKLGSATESANLRDGRRIVQVHVQIQHPRVHTKLVAEVTVPLPSLATLMKIIGLWTLMEITFANEFFITPFVVAVFGCYVYMAFDW